MKDCDGRLPPSIASSSMDSFRGTGTGLGSCSVDEIIPPSSLIDVIVKASFVLLSGVIDSLIGAIGR